MNLEVLYILFWIYAIAGFLMEVIRIIIREHRLVNRGFFLGPYCPIYGVGGVVLSFINNYRGDPFIVFIVSVVVCSAIEYLASYILELIFKVRWWDYSDRFLNVNGRICLINTIGFGILGMVIVCYLNPLLINFISNLNPNFRHILTTILIIVTSIDFIVTFAIMFDIREMIIGYKPNYLKKIFKPNMDNSEEINLKVRTILKEKTIFHKHMLKAYSNFKVYKDQFLQKTEDLIKYKKWTKIENVYMFIFLSCLLTGLIIGIIIKQVRVCACVSILIAFLIWLILSRGNNEK